MKSYRTMNHTVSFARTTCLPFFSLKKYIGADKGVHGFLPSSFFALKENVSLILCGSYAYATALCTQRSAGQRGQTHACRQPVRRFSGTTAEKDRRFLCLILTYHGCPYLSHELVFNSVGHFGDILFYGRQQHAQLRLDAALCGHSSGEGTPSTDSKHNTPMPQDNWTNPTAIAV